jgi:hypothetical protein
MYGIAKNVTMNNMPMSSRSFGVVAAYFSPRPTSTNMFPSGLGRPIRAAALNPAGTIKSVALEST